jgi:hypothetical protein
LHKSAQQAFRDVERLSTELNITQRECERLTKNNTLVTSRCSELESRTSEAEALAKDAVARRKRREAKVR